MNFVIDRVPIVFHLLNDEGRLVLIFVEMSQHCIESIMFVFYQIQIHLHLSINSLAYCQ